MASFTTPAITQVKRTDLKGKLGWLFGIERWKYSYVIMVSETWTKEQHNNLIAESGKWYDVG